MIISTLRASNLPRFRGALTGLKHTSRCICNTTRMAKPDHSERTADEPRDPVRNRTAQNDHLKHLLTQWTHSTVAPHGHSQAHRGGQPLNPHLPPRHPARRGEHQGEHARVITGQVPARQYLSSNDSHPRVIWSLPRVLFTGLPSAKRPTANTSNLTTNSSSQASG